MYNAHPQFSQKNLGTKCTLYMDEYIGFLPSPFCPLVAIPSSLGAETGWELNGTKHLSGEPEESNQTDKD